MSDKIQEYLDAIASEKSGEAVRDAVERAIITTNAYTSSLGRAIDWYGVSVLKKYYDFVDDCIDTVCEWVAETEIAPDFVRPAPPSKPDPIVPVSNDLVNTLSEFKNAVEGIAIRSSLYASLSLIKEYCYNSNPLKYYYIDYVVSVFNAIIDQADTTDIRKETASKNRYKWRMTEFYNRNIKAYHDAITSDLADIASAKTGNVVRPLITDAITNIYGANQSRADRQYDSTAAMIFNQVGDDYDRIVGDLFPVSYSDRYLISLGGPYAHSEIDAKYAEIEELIMYGSPGPISIYTKSYNRNYIILMEPRYNTSLIANIMCENYNLLYFRMHFEALKMSDM